MKFSVNSYYESVSRFMIRGGWREGVRWVVGEGGAAGAGLRLSLRHK